MSSARRKARAASSLSRLAFREPIDGPGAYSAWLRKLRNQNGTYVIRTRRRKLVLYVGESHTSNLYGTLTRHFQAWRGPTAGTRYKPELVEVAVRLCGPACTLNVQRALIRALRPRDNKLLKPDLSDVPF